MSEADKLIVALDFAHLDEARKMVEILGDRVSFYKVGMELAYDLDGLRFACGLKDQGKRVFLDLKLHDIPNTVERTTRKLAQYGVDFLSVHGYPNTMIAAAAGAADSNLQVFGVTVLTSEDQASVNASGYTITIKAIMGQRTDFAINLGMAGLICGAGEETRWIKSWSRDKLKIITPGIRLDKAGDDQRRVATPKAAIEAGSDYLVVGRPITRNEDPIRAVEEILGSMARAKQ